MKRIKIHWHNNVIFELRIILDTPGHWNGFLTFETIKRKFFNFQSNETTSDEIQCSSTVNHFHNDIYAAIYTHVQLQYRLQLGYWFQKFTSLSYPPTKFGTRHKWTRRGRSSRAYINQHKESVFNFQPFFFFFLLWSFQLPQTVQRFKLVPIVLVICSNLYRQFL